MIGRMKLAKATTQICLRINNHQPLRQYPAILATSTDMMDLQLHGSFAALKRLSDRLKISRLEAVFDLKTEQIVDTVLELALGPINTDAVSVRFRGTHSTGVHYAF